MESFRAPPRGARYDHWLWRWQGGGVQTPPPRQGNSAECAPPSPDINSLHLFFWNFINEDIYADDFKTVKELNGTIVNELGHSHSQTVDKSLTDQGTICLPAVTLCKRAQKGVVTLNAADGQPRIGMTDDIVNLNAISLTFE